MNLPLIKKLQNYNKFTMAKPLTFHFSNLLIIITGRGIPFDNKFYENYIKIHYKTVIIEIGDDGIRHTKTKIIKARNCELEDFTSVRNRSNTWIENRKLWFNNIKNKGIMGCPESLKEEKMLY